MNRYEFQLHISSAAYLDYYRGTILHVISAWQMLDMSRYASSMDISSKVAPVSATISMMR